MIARLTLSFSRRDVRRPGNLMALSAHQVRSRVLDALLFASLLFFAAHPDPASALEVRLVAAEQPDAPPVSTKVDFRRAADGGLIATQWLSGVTLGKEPLFPVTDRSARAPKAPEVSEENVNAG